MMPQCFNDAVHMVANQEELVGILRIFVSGLFHQRVNILLSFLDVFSHTFIGETGRHTRNIVAAVEKFYDQCDSVAGDPIVVGLVFQVCFFEICRLRKQPDGFPGLIIYRQFISSYDSFCFLSSLWPGFRYWPLCFSLAKASAFCVWYRAFALQYAPT